MFSNLPIEIYVLAGGLIAWFLIPMLTGLLHLRLREVAWRWKILSPPPPKLSPEQLRLQRQLRAERTGERVEIGYGRPRRSSSLCAARAKRRDCQTALGPLYTA